MPRRCRGSGSLGFASSFAPAVLAARGAPWDRRAGIAVGGWTKELFGPDTQVLAGIAGASVATFFTFLPSFLFILVGAPMVEATRHDLKFTAPLTGITAAVVGVILNLALFFAWHVLWPEAADSAPFAGRFEWFSLVITLAPSSPCGATGSVSSRLSPSVPWPGSATPC